jgi:hypothetical protein
MTTLLALMWGSSARCIQQKGGPKLTPGKCFVEVEGSDESAEDIMQGLVP